MKHTYKLFDLEIITTGDPKTFNCSHQKGEKLVIKGENISFGEGTKQFSHYALATLIPYIAAKQRADKEHDWMYFESQIACPDPQCGAVFTINRVGSTEYEYSPID